jgi:AcrR family transcriptional regulator
VSTISWGTTKERLVRGALREFGARGFDDVNVGELARDAEVTIGSLHPHFGSKQGLYEVVRTDVERRASSPASPTARSPGRDAAARRALAGLLSF